MPTIRESLLGGADSFQPPENPSWLDYAADIPRGAATGVAGFGQSFGDIANFVSRDLFQGGNVIPPEYLTEETLPDWMRTRTWVGGLQSGLVQAGLGLATIQFGGGAAATARVAGSAGSVGKFLTGASRTAKVVQGLTKGAAVDALAFRGDTGHLSDLIREMGGVGDNALTRYLSTNDEDSWLEGRMKNVIEGGILGTGLEVVLFPALRAAKGRMFGKAPEEALRGLPAETGDNVRLLMQDPKEASRRGLIPPDLAEKLLKVNWDDEKFRPEGANRERFATQLRESTQSLPGVADAALGLTDAFVKVKAGLTDRSVDEVYAEMFAGVQKTSATQLDDALYQLDRSLAEPATPMQGKAPIADGNPETIVSGLETLNMRHPDPTASTKAFGDFLSDVFRGRDGLRPIVPERLIEYVNKPGAIAERLKQLTPEQISAREKGMAEAKAIRATLAGENGHRSVGSMVLWGFLSKMLGAFPHEAGAIELIAKKETQDLFDRMLAGRATDADIAAWKQLPIESKAASPATQNRNSFADDFLTKLKEKRSDGRTHFARLVEIFQDNNLTGPQKRRLILSEMPKGHGIGSKVWSFNLLVTGHDDVIVLDRWQIRNLFDRGGLPKDVDLYSGSDVGDGLDTIFSGYKALALYEAMESGLSKRVAAEYATAGLPGPSVGALHWDFWNWVSKQSAAHTSLEGIAGKFRGDEKAFSHSHSSETLLNSTLYGTKAFPVTKQASVTIGSITRWMSLKEADEFGAWIRKNVIPESWRDKAKSLGLPGPFDVTKIRQEILPDDQQPWYNFLPPAERKRLEQQLAKLGSDERPGASPESREARATSQRLGRSGSVLFQRGPNGDASGQLRLPFDQGNPRGAVQFAKDGRALVHLFETADASTVVHELGHVFRQHLSSISPELLRQAEKSLGVSFSAKGQALTNAEEAWARAFETYVSKGMAPTPELKTVFGQFKDWLRNVYGTLMGSPVRDKIKPELRNVFDTMLGKYGPADVTAQKPSMRRPNTQSKLVTGIRSSYMESIGGNHPGRQNYAEVHQPTSQRIADAYEAMQHNPNDPAVKASYKALLEETNAQLKQMEAAGIRIVPTDGNPYPSSQAMMDDVETNKRLYVQKTLSDVGGSDLPMDHPMMVDSGMVLTDANGKPHKMLMNDVFRAVHDFFGHAAEGYQFGQRGEENAWISHALMFSPEARPAMTTETRGQNSWVNSGKHIRRADGSIPLKGDSDYVEPGARPFAQQKAGLLPDWATQHPELGDAPAMAAGISNDLAEAAARGVSSGDSLDAAVRGNINVSRISTTEDAVKVIEAVDQSRDKVVGRMTMDEMADLINDGEMPREQVLAFLGNHRKLVEKQIVVIGTARVLHVQAGEAVAKSRSALDDALKAGAGDLDALGTALVDDMNRVIFLHNIMQEAKANAGRLVKSFDLTADADKAKFERISQAAQELADEATSPEQNTLQAMVKKAAEAGDKDKVDLLKAMAAMADNANTPVMGHGDVDFLRGGPAETSSSRAPTAPRDTSGVMPDTTGSEQPKPYTPSEIADGLRRDSGEAVGTMRDGSAPKAPATGEVMQDTTGAELHMSDRRAGGMIGGQQYVTVHGTRIPAGVLLRRSQGVAQAAAAGPAALAHNTASAVNAARSGWFPIFLEFQKAALLSGLTTVTNNGLSAAIMTTVTPVFQFAGSAVSGNTAQMKKSWSLMTNVFGALRDVVSNTWTATPGDGQQGLRTLASTIKNENPTLLKVSGVEHTPKLTAKGVGLSDTSTAGKATNALGRVVRLPFTAHQVMDEFFSNVNYLAYVRTKAGEIAERTILSNQNLPEDVRQRLATEFIDRYSKGAFSGDGSAITRQDGRFFHEDAARYAKSVNFTQDLTYGIGNSLMKLKGEHPWLDILLPFVTVPTNIIRQGMRMTPGLNLIASYSSRLVSKTPEEVMKARGELAMGTAIWGSAIYMASTGGITGAGPASPQERETLKASGWQPYSFKVDNPDGTTEYISFARLEPFAMMLGIAADYTDAAAYLQEGERDEFAARAVTSLAHNLTDKTYLTGISDFMKAITNPERNGAAYLRNRTAALVPNFFAKIGNASDDQLRETRTMLDAVRNRLPFAREGSMPRRNILGETMTPPAGFLPFGDPREGVAGFIGRSASPVQYSRQSSDAVINELALMKYAFSKMSPNTQGVDTSLFIDPRTKQTAYDRMQELSGQIQINGRSMHDELDRVISSTEYQRAPMPLDKSEQYNPKIQMLQRVLSRYRLAAQKQTLKEFPELKQAIDDLKMAGKTGVREPSPVLAILSR